MEVVWDGTPQRGGRQLFIPEEVRVVPVTPERKGPPARLPEEPSGYDLVRRRDARILQLLRSEPRTAPDIALHFNASQRQARAWLYRLLSLDRVVVIGMRLNPDARGREPIEERVYDAKHTEVIG